MEDNEFADILLRLAEDDLRASRTLYEEKLYQISVFHLQQAVEKATKALGILLGRTDVGDLQTKISHKPSRIFAEYVTEISESFGFIGKLIQFYPDLSSYSFVKDVVSSSLTEDDLKNARELMLNPESRKFEKLDLRSLDEFLEEIRSFEPNGDRGVEVSDENLKQVRRVIVEVTRLIESFSKQRAEEMRSAFKKLDSSGELRGIIDEAKESFQNFMYCSVALLHLSLLFFPHSITTRYPEQKGNFNPYVRYTPYYPIIVRIAEIQEIVKKAVSAIRILGFPRKEI